MKSTTVLIILVSFLTGCAKNKSCPDWYEGTNCQTQMRQKWIGTYIGITHTDASLTGQLDTFTFVPDSTRIDYDHCANKNFDLSIRNTREASFNTGAGLGVVSEDGKYATLTFTPYDGLFGPVTHFDSTTTYTFEGTKQ